MRILVMGAGALGSVAGGFLARAGHEVHLVGRQPHMDAIKKNGLVIEGIWGTHHIRMLTCADFVEALPKTCYDYILVSVKSYDTAQTASLLLPVLSEKTWVCSYQNGLGNAELLAKELGWKHVLGARVIFGARMVEAGRVEVTVIAADTAVGGYGAPQNNDKWNGLVIAGFVCAFLVPIVGLILSIIGMVQINKNGGKSKGMAIAGILVSVVVMVLNGLLVFSMLNAANSAVQTAITASQSPSSSSSSPSTTDPDIDDLDNDIDDLDDDLDDLDNDVDTLPEGVTLEDLLSMPTFKEQIERQTTAGMPDNMDMKVSAKGNTLTFDATINESLTDDQVEQVRSMAESVLGSQMEEIAGNLNSELGTDDVVVHLTMKLADGQTIVDKDYTE